VTSRDDQEDVRRRRGCALWVPAGRGRPARRVMHVRFIAYLLVALLAGGVATATEEPHPRALEHFIRGTFAAEMENHYQAIFHFQEALRSDPDSPFLRVALAQEYLMLDQPGRALEIVDEALEKEPGFAAALEVKAGILRVQGKLPDALRALESLVAAAPEETKYYYDLLFGYLSTGDYESADRVFDTHLKESPALETVLRQVLAVYVMADERERALPYLEELVEIDTSDADLVYSLGSLYLQVRDTLRGERSIRRALEMEPSESRYWFALAVLAYDREEYGRVVEIVDEAHESVAEHAGLLNLKGNSLSRLSLDVEAAAALERTIALDSTAFGAMGTLALIYDRLDRVERVVELYERAIELSDSAAVYMNNLAYTFAERGLELARADTLVDLALEMEPENPSYLDTKAWIEYRRGNHDEAVTWMKRAIKQDRASAPLYDHLGDIYMALDKRSKARKYYRKALDLDPGNAAVAAKLGDQ